MAEITGSKSWNFLTITNVTHWVWLVQNLFLFLFGIWIETALTPVSGLFWTHLGFQKIFKTQWVVKTQKSALLVLWKGIINPALQSLVNQYFSQREKYWLTKFEQFFSGKNHEKKSPHLKPPRNLGIFENTVGFSSPTEWNYSRENTWITPTLLENIP